MPPTLRAPIVFAILMVVSLAGVTAQTTRPSRPAPKPLARAERPVPFALGESMAFDISWSSYLTAGTATIQVRGKKPSSGSQAYHLVAEGQPTPLISRLYPLFYRAESLLDVYTVLPHQGVIYSEEGGRKQTKTVRFDQAARTATFDVQPGDAKAEKIRLRAGTHDALSAFFALRALAMKPGARYTLPMADDGSTFDVQVTVGARESVRSGLGTLPAWRLTPVLLDGTGRPAGDYSLALWISDDSRRLPLRFEANLSLGTFVFTLRSVGR